jgi:hypothetical protein
MEAPAIKRNSLLLTLFIHGAIFLMLWWFVMSTKIPPFGGGGGAESSNIGFVEISTGNIQPVAENVSENPRVQPTPTPPATASETNYATQETEESTSIEAKKNKKENKKEVKPLLTPPTRPTVKVTEPVVPKVNAEALYPGKRNNATSQGTGTIAAGDQGSRDGDPNALYQGKGTGQGGNGNGGGEGDGSGPGRGSGTGPGFSYDLSGRTVKTRPAIYDNSQETGKVVVSIKVDKYGTVLEAVPGARGTTTTSSNLFRKAKEAALKAKFNQSPEGVEEQRGTITFVFLVQ